jgi:hypothetical protein
MTGSYTICWNIWRLGKDLPSVKMAGTNCPCKHDPEKNKTCPLYEEVVVHQP